MAAGPLVHVHGGRHLLETLVQAGLPGERLEWCDPVCCGPTPAGLSLEAFYRVRGAHLAGGLSPAVDVDGARDRLRRQDQELLAIPPATEIVIWVGPELFCQSILMRLLTLLGEGGVSRRISLVDPGDQPGLRGCPMGRLPAEGLRRIFQQRRPADPEGLALAARAWAAFTAPDARPLVALLSDDTSALPHLGPALARHLDDLPDGATGLSTTETRLLQSLEQGPMDLGPLLSALADREPRPFLTDDWLTEIVMRLASGDAPLVTWPADHPITLTNRGRDVLAGHDFWAADRWLGGIHITPTDDDEDAGSAPVPPPPVS